MKLYAKKPCSFCGQKFFIGDEIPAEFVIDPKAQKMMGVIEVVEGKSDTADPIVGGPLLPPTSTLEDETADKEEKADAGTKKTKARSTRKG